MRPKIFSRHPGVGCWTYRLWRAFGSEDPHKTPLFNFRFVESREYFSQILKRRSSPVHGFYKLWSDRVWCVGLVAGFCAILPVLGVAHSSLRPSENSSEASLSSVFAGLSHSHKKTTILRLSQLETHQQRHYLQVTTDMPAILAVSKLIQQLL